MQHDAPFRPDPLLVLRLAAAAGADPRSARKALIEGPAHVRGLVGARLSEAMRELGLASAPEKGAA